MIGHFSGVDAVEDGVEPSIFECFGEFRAGCFFIAFEGLVWLGDVETVLDKWAFDFGFGATEENFEVGVGGGKSTAFEETAVTIAHADEILYFEVGRLGTGCVVGAATGYDEANSEHKNDGEPNDNPGEATAEEFGTAGSRGDLVEVIGAVLGWA